MSTIHARRAGRGPDVQGCLFGDAPGFAAGVSNPNDDAVIKISPFRYPGGKTWLAPDVRDWLAALPRRPSVFVEPFAGGGSVSLNVAAAGLADRVRMVEIDPDVASVWTVALKAPEGDLEDLCARIRRFQVGRGAVVAALAEVPACTVGRAFRTILRNRMNRDGNLTGRAGLQREGEAGRGLASRWYPTTLVRRLRAVRSLAGRVDFVHGDAFAEMARYAGDPGAAFFVDPPYTAGGAKVGSRLYPHSDVDHPALFALASTVRGPAMLTYDDVPEAEALAAAHGMAVERVPMRGTQRKVKFELVMTKAAA